MPAGGYLQAATRARTSSAVRTIGAMMPSTPRSSACLIITWSFQGTRIIGTVGLPLNAMRADCSRSRLQGVCSVSISR